jgi:PilZ domain-containing protein
MTWNYLNRIEGQEVIMPRAARATAPTKNLPSDLSSLRREERLDIALPVRLIYSRPKAVDEIIPGILIDLSASGFQIFTDRRFSLLLPPTPNTRLEIEFFLDELEIRQVPIQVVRVKQLENYQLMLGCKFVNLPTAARLALRAEVCKRVSNHRR